MRHRLVRVPARLRRPRPKSGRTSPGAGDIAVPGLWCFRFVKERRRASPAPAQCPMPRDGSNPEPRHAPPEGAGVPGSRLEAVIGRSRSVRDEGLGALGTCNRFRLLPAWKRWRVSCALSVPGFAEDPSECSLTGTPRSGRPRQRIDGCRVTGIRAWRRRDRDSIGRGLHGEGGSHGTGS